MNGPSDAPDDSTATARRSQFVDATLELLEGCAPVEISMDGIAQHAGVSRPLLYTYFADRDALLVAAYNRFFAPLQAEVDSLMAGADPDDVTMREIIRSYLSFAREHEAQYRHLLDGGLVLHPEIRSARQARFERLATTWGADDDAVLVATVLVGILETAALAWLDHGGHDVDHTTDLVWSLAWTGLQAIMG